VTGIVKDASGNVGIGTASPTSKLHVSTGVAGNLAYFTDAINTDFYIKTASSIATIGPNAGSTNLAFQTSGTERMRIDSSGNVGIGTSSPSAKLDVNGNIATEGGNTKLTLGLDQGGGAVLLYNSNGNLDITPRSGYNVVIPSGNLLVGTTSGTIYKAQFYAGDQYAFLAYNTNSAKALGDIWNSATSGDNKFFNFLTEAGGTQRGSITYNRAGGLVAYNVTSDYRAKDINGPVTGSGALIDSTPVYMGKMKDATQERPMFIAHEVPAYAHTGEKDAVDKDGNPVYQQMDASALIPVMWAEIQSLRKRLAALEAK
jgi:hypothetical protein